MFPIVNLGIDSTNVCVDIQPGNSRWPLFLGGEPALGPIVLFWSELIVILIIALILSITGWTRFSTPILWSKVQWRKANPKIRQ